MLTRFPAFAVLFTLVLALFGTADPAGANPYRAFVEARLAAKAGPARRPAAIAIPRIVGGGEAEPGSLRFQVALLFADTPDNFAAYYCGGSLYHGRFVITAAHCSDFVKPQNVRVLVGTHKLDGSGKRYKVRKIIIHPKWDDFTFDYDIAIWCLEEEVGDAPKLYIANHEVAVGTMMRVSGWGALSEIGPSPLTLHQVQVPKVSKTNCNDANSYNGDVTRRMLCAGYDGGGFDSCFGDSGGPLTRPRPEGGRILAGIVSWGDGCALPDKFGVYTRISNKDIYRFIREVTWPWPMATE